MIVEIAHNSSLAKEQQKCGELFEGDDLES
jgi:hypothetical protein